MEDDLDQPQQPRGWHSRGRLPHLDGGPLWQFITLHLGDALPQEVLERWQRELEHETVLSGARRLLTCGSECY